MPNDDSMLEGDNKWDQHHRLGASAHAEPELGQVSNFRAMILASFRYHAGWDVAIRWPPVI